MRVDHVVLASTDLEAAAARLLDIYGLDSVPGGAHPQWGTANRIVPLHGQYLEIIGITDRELAATNPVGAWVTNAAADGEMLLALMVEPEDFQATCRRLSLTPTPGRRTRPDGSSAAWQLAGMAETISRDMPCFIEWNDRDEAFDGGAGVGPTGIAAVELGGDRAEISSWLAGPVPGVILTGGRPGIHRLTIATGNGEVVLPRRPFAGSAR